MATQTVIQIKKSGTATAPATLANGEMAYTANGDVLFIGSPDGSNTVTAIGGKRTPGILTANQGLVANATGYLNVIKTANLYIGSVTVNTINSVANSTVIGLASNSELTTTWAIKTYVDAKAASASNPGGSNTYIQFNDSSVLGGTSGLTFNKTSNTITVGNATLFATVNSTIYSATSANATLFAGQSLATVQGWITSNSATAFSNAVANAVANAATKAATAFSNAVANAANYSNTVAGTAYANAIAYSSIAGNLLSGTVPSARLTGNYSGITGLGTIAGLTTTGVLNAVDVTVSGNLSVTGSLITVDATNLVVKDSLIELANGNVSTDSLDIGLFGQYGASGVKYTGLFRDQTDGVFKLFTGLTVKPTTVVDTANTSYTRGILDTYIQAGALVANATNVSITANSTVAVALVANSLSLSTALTVGNGGTGKSSFTLNSVLVGNTTGALTEVTGSNYQILQLDGSGAVTFGNLDGGTF